MTVLWNCLVCIWFKLVSKNLFIFFLFSKVILINRSFLSHSFQFTDKSSQEERIYTSYLLLLIVVSCSLASLAVGYIYLSCSHLFSFASYNRPYALKIKSHAVTRGCQFLLDVVFCMLLYERLSTFCMFTESLLYEHSVL